MVPIDKRIASCLAHLRAPEFAAFCEWLTLLKADAVEIMGCAESEHVIRRMQGRVGLLKDILESIHNAPVIAQRLENSEHPG